MTPLTANNFGLIPVHVALSIICRAETKEGSYELIRILEEWQPRGVPAIEALLRWTDELFQADPVKAEKAARVLSAGSAQAAPWIKARILQNAKQHALAAETLDSFCAMAPGYNDDLEAFRYLLLAGDHIQTQNWPDAAQALTSSIRLTSSYSLICRTARLVDLIKGSGKASFKCSCRVAIVGNATFDFNVPALHAYAFASGIELQLLKGDFNQHYQQVLDPNSSLARFKPEFIIVATDWRSLAFAEEVPPEIVKERIGEIRALWRECRNRFGAVVIQHNFVVPPVSAYGRLSVSLPAGRARAIRDLNTALENAAAEERDVFVLDVEQVAGVFGKNDWEDYRLWLEAKQYPSTKAIPLLARHQTSIIRAALGLTAKCIALDLDNTLWGGVIGENGLKGIRLGGSTEGEAYVNFQAYLKSLNNRGIILAVCSKNDEAAAKLPFQQHPEMVLKLEDVSVFIANWDTKDRNLRQIASALNIGTDALVFVDDNPAERALIRKFVPEVEVPEIGTDPALFSTVLARTLSFESLHLTLEDRSRIETYRSNVARRELQESAGNLDDYLAQLRMYLQLRPFDDNNMPRIMQLIHKTNQFNLTTRRFSEEQVRRYKDDPDAYTQFVHLRDRFGDQGLIGVLMASRDGDVMSLDEWLISCRVLGRRVEDAMLSGVWNFAQSLGLKSIRGSYLPTPKNHVVCDLFDRFSFRLGMTDEDGTKHYQASLSSAREYPNCFDLRDQTQADDRIVSACQYDTRDRSREWAQG